MSVSIITHKGREIIFGNFSGLTDQKDIIHDGLEAAELVKNSKGHVYLLTDFEGAAVGTDFMSAIKDEGKFILKNIPLTTAVTGITGLKKIMIQGYIRVTGSKLRIFDTNEEAKDYLAGV